MSYTPLTRDRLGAERMWNSNACYALDAASTAIPNNETIVVLNWARHFKNALVATDHYVGVGPMETVGGKRVSVMRNGDTIKLGAYSAAWQQLSVPIPDESDHLWALVLDRDNGNTDAYLDGTLVDTAVTTQNPDLTANNRVQFNNSTAGLYRDIHWRCAILTFANGSTPSQAQLATAFGAMADPDAPMHATITAALGTIYSDWRPGEGIYGATTINDDGTTGDDLTWQGGTTVEDVRVRAAVPWVIPRRTWYAVKSGYTAATAATNFGFAVQPVIVRMVCGVRSAIPTVNNYYTPGVATAGSIEYIGRYHTLAGAGSYVRSGGVTRSAIDESLYYSAVDCWLVADGTTMYEIANGQWIKTPAALAAALDLTGNSATYIKYATGDRADVCRIAAWNPATVPATLLDEIRACVCDPENDPPSLTNKLVDFPLHSGLLPLGTETTVANQGTGGGTLTLSAARSTSCEVMLQGHNP